MGQQHNKVEKRIRRKSYLKRLKSRAAAGAIVKKRPAARVEAKDADAAKKKAVKKKVVKKKAADKPVEAVAEGVIENVPEVVETPETTAVIDNTEA